MLLALTKYFSPILHVLLCQVHSSSTSTLQQRTNGCSEISDLKVITKHNNVKHSGLFSITSLTESHSCSMMICRGY